jgi:hypothetical protein
MSLESGTYISDLVVTNPPGTDPKSQGDDHLRLIKATLKNTFPNVAGAATASHTQLQADKLGFGDSADPANNFTLDASANNGTMKLARNSGQEIMKVDANGKVGFPQNAQVWSQPLRDLGITYTNDTGQPITINFSGYINNTTNRFIFQVNGVAVAYSAIGSVANSVVTLSGMVVPAGATYLITQNGGTPSVDFWAELR